MGTGLIRYDAACQALARAWRVDEVKAIRDKAEAVRAYAVQTKDTELVSMASEIKLRAMRRLGELLGPDGVARAKVGQPVGKMSSPPTSLNDLDISRDLSSTAQRIAAVPEEKFEAHLAQMRAEHQDITVIGVSRLLKIASRNEKKANLPGTKFPKGKYRVIYADPPWEYADKADEGSVQSGGATKHYPTMSTAELCALPVQDLGLDDSALFLWVTSPLLPDGLKVVDAWGYKYKASFVWDKIKHNMGHYNSVRHEFLLVCTRGSCVPDSPKLFDSVQSIERTKRHSEKPEEFRRIIDAIYPVGPRIELFRRGAAPKGWRAWGNEAGK